MWPNRSSLPTNLPRGVVFLVVLVVVGGSLLAASGAGVVYVFPGDGDESDGTIVETEAYAEEIEEIHKQGVTGDGVRVGIIGSAFDPTHEAIADRVRSHRNLELGQQSVSPDPDHDTAVAEVVAETAPNAELELVSIGSQPSATVYHEAVGQLVYRDVDVILDAGSYFPQSRADAEAFDRAVESAREDGVVFVTSAGNYAEHNWLDTIESEGWVAFDEDDIEANRLGDGTVSGQLTLRLAWDGQADLELYLYRHLPDAEDKVVARSTDDEGPGGIEGIDVLVPSGSYYVAVYADAVEEPTNVRLLSGTQPLEYVVPEESVTAPADSDAAISVSATEDGMLRPDSSRGSDVTVNAPGVAETDRGTLEGTSAATSHVAGAIALVKSHEPRLSPNDTVARLRSSATDRSVDRLSPREMFASIESGEEYPTTRTGESSAAETPETTAAETPESIGTEEPARNRSKSTAERSTAPAPEASLVTTSVDSTWMTSSRSAANGTATGGYLLAP